MVCRRDGRLDNNAPSPSSSPGKSAQNTTDFVLIDDSELVSLQARPSFRKYLKLLWQRRHFTIAEARSRAFETGRGMLLGNLWIILNPLLQVTVYAFIFGWVLNVSRGIDNFVGFLVIGVIFFGFLSRGITVGSGLIQNSTNMIASFSFPKASLVFSAVLRSLLDNTAPAVVAIIVAVAFQHEQPIHWTIVFVVPIFLLIHVFCLGTTLIVSRATAFIPDLKAVLPVFTRGLFFVSGVFFSIERYATEPTLQSIMVSNPIYQFLQAIRSCVLEGSIPAADTWLYLVAWSFGLLLFGVVYFWQAEERYTSVR